MKKRQKQSKSQNPVFTSIGTIWANDVFRKKPENHLCLSFYNIPKTDADQWCQDRSSALEKVSAFFAPEEK